MRVLVVRPSPSCEALVAQLTKANIYAMPAPFLTFDKGKTLNLLTQRLNTLQQNDMVISVSPRAIEYAHTQIIKEKKSWRNDLTYIAVGEQTAMHWHNLANINPEVPLTHDSEGIINLLRLRKHNAKQVVILRGNGGREFLSTELKKQGIDVSYVETYQRHWNTDQVVKVHTAWQKKQLNALIVSSGEQLTSLFYSLDFQAQKWLLSCHIFVPSQRIFALASTLGFTNMSCTNNASNHAFFHAIKALHKSG